MDTERLETRKLQVDPNMTPNGAISYRLGRPERHNCVFLSTALAES
jgi:hypothetical protein